MSNPSSEGARWRLLATGIALGLLFTAALLLGLPAARGLAQGPDVRSAHVVVQFADGTTAVRPISWTGTLTRVGALGAAGLSVEHNGDLVCSIEGEGCPAINCWCADNRWAQGQWEGNAWDTSAWPPPPLADGDVIAFRNGSKPDYSDWGLTGLLPAARTYVAASNALEWMRGQQQGDGSYNDGFGKTGASVRALIALGAARYDAADWGSPSLLDYLTVVNPTGTVAYAGQSAAGAGKLAIGAAWSGQTVTNFAGINLPLSITAHYNSLTGGYGVGSGDTAWAMLGLYAAGEDIPTTTIGFLYSVQNADGGWAWNEWGTSSEVQHTATCVQALLAAGEPPTATEVISALTFIASAKNNDGGYGYQPGFGSDVDTSAFVNQALLAVGPGPAGNWCTTVRCGYLFAEQADDGSFLFFGAPSLYATQEVIPALMHRPFGPLAVWPYNCFVRYLPVVARAFGTP
mgnify:CR=1 FL=1